MKNQNDRTLIYQGCPSLPNNQTTHGRKFQLGVLPISYWPHCSNENTAYCWGRMGTETIAQHCDSMETKKCVLGDAWGDVGHRILAGRGRARVPRVSRGRRHWIGGSRLCTYSTDVIKSWLGGLYTFSRVCHCKSTGKTRIVQILPGIGSRFLFDRELATAVAVTIMDGDQANKLGFSFSSSLETARIIF